MLSRQFRFHSRGGVKYTYKKGKTIRTPRLSLVSTPNTRHAQRFAVVISKKVLKSAVGRNRIRRRVYEAIRLELPNFKSHRDCIFIIYSRELKKLPFTELRATIRSLLAQSVI